MNVAYKWYSYNSNILEFYSIFSSAKRTFSSDADSVTEIIEQTGNCADTVNPNNNNKINGLAL